ncbi:NUDIX domain-containing protein [Rhodopirellula sp.]|nr:NUDIX domain-containing protein [Rubripirellula sp.]MDA7893630.1 NUDIX domain-containing protein [bacterium]MDB4423174.1 NUDIX domain-containing protein [Rhodopirellula sp.]MDB4624743.1 NUDIX domain-containing protein [Rubripirellula sp.]
MDSTSIENACRFCPRCGDRADVEGCVPFRCSQCGFANFFGPVAAVGGLVTNEQGELLLVRRAREPGKGKWGLPGGFVDRNETIEQALSREVLEETNLCVSEATYLTSFPNLYNYGGVVSPVIDLFYRCCVLDQAVIRLADGELDSFCWVRPSEEHLSKMAFPSNRRAIEQWLSTE